MKRYDGAVLFVDILGIGALTQGKIPLTEAELDPWKVSATDSGRHHLLAAKLLTLFRSSLRQIGKKDASIQVAQLSDCAFIWSANPVTVTKATRELMWRLARGGLLCRAGLAYGQIVEPDKVDRSLGHFILGEAVTKAAGLEGRGKGARVFCDTEVAHEMHKEGPSNRDLFAPLKNPLDGAVVDEFRWYRQPIQPSKRWNDAVSPLDFLQGLIELHTLLMYSPKFAWNSVSGEGRLQLACTIEAISSATLRYLPSGDYAFSVEHLMQVLGAPKRSDTLRVKIHDQFVREIPVLLSKK